MSTIKQLQPYSDENNNSIIIGEKCNAIDINVTFSGANNKLVLGNYTRGKVNVIFPFSNGLCIFEYHSIIRGKVRIGADCKVEIKQFTTITANAWLDTAEGTTICIGSDCMLASNVAIKTSDAHPIFSVLTEKRINPCKSIFIDEHVWIGDNSIILKGTSIGKGSVVGQNSLVVGKKIPNNCVAVGNPIRVVKKDIAWERPRLNIDPPEYKPDASTIVKSKYWDMTVE